MSVPSETVDPDRPANGTDVPQLRAALAWTGAIGLTLATALGIAAVLGASLGLTAARLVLTGVVCGVDALFALGAATLYQRARWLRIPAIAGVLVGVVAAAVALVGIWGGSVGETVGRIALVAGSLGSAFGVTGFLLSQQRQEDPPAITSLMLATLLLDWTLTIALSIDVIFAASGGPEAGGVHFPLSGIGFARFVGVTSLLTLLGLLLLPLLRRAHPAYRSGPPAH